MVVHVIAILRPLARLAVASRNSLRTICIGLSMSSSCFPQCWLNFQARPLNMMGTMATLDSLILIAGDPGRKHRLFLIFSTEVQVKTLIGPVQAHYPFLKKSLKLRREKNVL